MNTLKSIFVAAITATTVVSAANTADAPLISDTRREPAKHPASRMQEITVSWVRDMSPKKEAKAKVSTIEEKANSQAQKQLNDQTLQSIMQRLAAEIARQQKARDQQIPK